MVNLYNHFDLTGLLGSHRPICFYGGGAEVTQHNGMIQSSWTHWTRNSLLKWERMEVIVLHERTDWPDFGNPDFEACRTEEKADNLSPYLNKKGKDGKRNKSVLHRDTHHATGRHPATHATKAPGKSSRKSSSASLSRKKNFNHELKFFRNEKRNRIKNTNELGLARFPRRRPPPTSSCSCTADSPHPVRLPSPALPWLPSTFPIHATPIFILGRKKGKEIELVLLGARWKKNTALTRIGRTPLRNCCQRPKQFHNPWPPNHADSTWNTPRL